MVGDAPRSQIAQTETMRTPRSIARTLRRNRKESFQIQFGSDTSESSADRNHKIDDVFCSVDEAGSLDMCCESRESVVLWIIISTIVFLIPIVALSAVSHSGYSPHASMTIQNKTRIPQSSLIDKVLGSSPAPSRPVDLSLSPSQIRQKTSPPPTPIQTSPSSPTATVTTGHGSESKGEPVSGSSHEPSIAPVSKTAALTSSALVNGSSVQSISTPSMSSPSSEPSFRQSEVDTEPSYRLSLPSLNLISIPISLPTPSPVPTNPTMVSGGATVLQPSPTTVSTTIRLNCGGDQLVTSTPIGQQFWIPDRFYTSSGSPWQDRTCSSDDTLYCTARENVESYLIPVTNYFYAVTLHLLLSPGNDTPRAFDVLGTRVVVTQSPQRVVLKTNVENEVLSITFTTAPNAAPVLVAAIEVEPLADQDITIPNTASTTIIIDHDDIDKKVATYVPGDIDVYQQGLTLSRGLSARIVAKSRRRIIYANGTKSRKHFHSMPDAGATYPDFRPGNAGGWIYVSNSEMKPTSTSEFPGGVGALTFNRDGNVIDYQMVLTKTRMNCGGGRTPWGSWISGEEYANTGRIWQVDPTGQRKAERVSMGEAHSGLFESFAYDTRDVHNPKFFMTQDHKSGALRRFSPEDPDWEDPWNMLTRNGTLDYLVIEPSSDKPDSGYFQWSLDYREGADVAFKHFQNSEGIDVNGSHLFFVSKTFKTIFILDLDSGTYTNETTRNGLFNGQPDQIERIDESRPSNDNELMYFTEDGGHLAGVHARNAEGQYLTVLESSEYSDETTGLSFSPDGIHMYVAYQDDGVLFDVTRDDGLPFHAETFDIKFHQTD